MKWIKGNIIFILITLITLVFTINKIREASDLENMYSSVGVRFKAEGVTEKKLNEAVNEAEEKKELKFTELTAWKRIDEADIINKDLKRTRKVSVVLADGNMARTIPMALVNGNYVYPGDKKGCVIDEETAFGLFGTEAPVSGIVTYEKKDYVIRGVVKAEAPVFLIQGESDRIAYSNLEFTYKDKEGGEALTQEFLIRNGLADYIMIDGYFFGQLIHSLLTLPVWIFLFSAVFCTFKNYRKMKNRLSFKSFLLYGSIILFIAAGYIFLLYRFTGNPVYMPEKLIPTKWSDFDYWPEQYEALKDLLRQIRYLAPNPRDLLLTEELSKLGLNFSVMVILYLYILQFIRYRFNFLSLMKHQNMETAACGSFKCK